MAHSVPSRADAGAATTATKDVLRFRQFLTRGGPGPHAYVILLGMDTFDAPALFRALRKGFAYRAFEHLRRNSTLSAERVMALIGVPRRTLSRRKRDGRFLPDESDRLLRVSRLFGLALQLFEGDQAAATDWLETAQPALGGMAPLDLAGTEAGAREVERLMARLEHGVFS